MTIIVHVCQAGSARGPYIVERVHLSSGWLVKVQRGGPQTALSVKVERPLSQRDSCLPNSPAWLRHAWPHMVMKRPVAKVQSIKRQH